MVFCSEKENIQSEDDCVSRSSCPSVAGSLCWLPWETYKNNKIQGRNFKGVKNKGRENHWKTRTCRKLRELFWGDSRETQPSKENFFSCASFISFCSAASHGCRWCNFKWKQNKNKQTKNIFIEQWCRVWGSLTAGFQEPLMQALKWYFPWWCYLGYRHTQSSSHTLISAVP